MSKMGGFTMELNELSLTYQSYKEQIESLWRSL